MRNNQSIAVFLPTCNEHLSIAECINRFEALDIVDHVIVVNNNAHPATSPAVAATSAIKVFELEQGYGAAICELLVRGIPVVTNMSTHGEGHEGLVVVEGDLASVVRVVDQFGEEQFAQNAGAVARAHAEKWTATNVATALRSWLVDQSSPILSGPA